MAVLGVIADDFTGATDIAGMLVKGGMRTIQTIGVPAKGTIPDDVDAVVVALKTRSIAAKDADRPVARCAEGAAGGGLRALLLQILLDLRFDRRRQYRPGGRRAARRAEGQAGDLLPGLPGERPHHLLRPSVRGRPAAVGLAHAPSSAESDDRCQPGARAGAPDQAQGRTGAAEAGAGGLRRRCAPRSTSSRPTACAMSWSMPWPIPISASSARRSATTCWSPAARAWRWACPPPIAAAACWRTRPMPTRCPRSPAPPPCSRARARPRRWARSRPSRARTLHLDTDAICRGEAGRRQGAGLGQGQARQRADPALGQRQARRR